MSPTLSMAGVSQMHTGLRNEVLTSPYSSLWTIKSRGTPGSFQQQSPDPVGVPREPQAVGHMGLTLRELQQGKTRVTLGKAVSPGEWVSNKTWRPGRLGVCDHYMYFPPMTAFL